jgi:sensor histidine kinase YesM
VIRIIAKRHEGFLQLFVHDNGPGFPTIPFRPTGSHLGLQNTRERLEHLYGDRGGLELRNHPDGGAVVLVRVPGDFEPTEVPRG